MLFFLGFVILEIAVDELEGQQGLRLFQYEEEILGKRKLCFEKVFCFGDRVVGVKNKLYFEFEV